MVLLQSQLPRMLQSDDPFFLRESCQEPSLIGLYTGSRASITCACFQVFVGSLGGFGSFMKVIALTFGLIVVLTSLAARSASAVPILQLYLEGGVYDTQTESWVLTPAGSSAGAPFRLWVIGNVDGPGGKGDILDVRLSVAYQQKHLGLTLSMASSTTGGYGGYVDPSVARAASQNIVVNTSKGVVNTGATSTPGVVTNGSTPVLGDGSNLPAHGIYGTGTVWQEYALGDFTLKDSPIADFIGGFPVAPGVTKGQINVYEISVLGGSGARLHFDVYDHIEGENHARFAPFSHDGDGNSNIVPEPVSCIMWGGIGLAALLVARRKRRNLTA